jgi:Mg-chelatase subunit ChlD
VNASSDLRSLQSILDTLLRIPAKGLTNIAFPLQVAARELARVPTRDAQVLLLSDCVNNAGPEPRPLAAATDSELLLRGTAIDRAGERLIIDAAEELTLQRRQPGVQSLADISGQTELINNVLASGDTKMAALLRPPAPKELEPELEP